MSLSRSDRATFAASAPPTIAINPIKLTASRRPLLTVRAAPNTKYPKAIGAMAMNEVR
jgi:hypothetical protein